MPDRARRSRKDEEAGRHRGRTASPAAAAAPREKMPEPDPEAPLREAREACGGVRASTKRVTLECPICWQDVAKTSAGLSQHQFWSELCNTYLCLAEF